MQHQRFFRIVARALPLVILTYFSLSFVSPSTANATISAINVADLNTVSAVENVGATNFVIFGGTVGTCAAAQNALTNSTCSSCLKQGSGDSGLQPCNDHRINPNLQLTITFVSTVAGYPSITTEPATGTGTVLTPVTTSGTVAAGGTASVTLRWSDLCGAMTITGGTGGPATNCNLAGNALATGKFHAGVSATAGTAPTADNETEFTVEVSAGDITATAAGSLVTSASGITYFELSSGDGLAEIRNNIRRSTGFPTGPGINYRWVRALFEKRAIINTPVWTTITPGSPHVDLEVQRDATDATVLSLSPVRITSGSGTKTDGTGYTVDLTNDSVYDFKLAVVDQAGNVGFYTGNGTTLGKDQYCDSPASTSLGSGVPECHTARPSDVAGILANKMNCFVATAAYGSPMAGEVNAFRRFRDTYLIPTKLGFQFVRTYYKYGPVAARFIAKSETLRALSRALLWAPLQFAKISMAYGLMAGLAALAAALAGIFALTFAAKKLLGRGQRGFRA